MRLSGVFPSPSLLRTSSWLLSFKKCKTAVWRRTFSVGAFKWHPDGRVERLEAKETTKTARTAFSQDMSLAARYRSLDELLPLLSLLIDEGKMNEAESIVMALERSRSEEWNKHSSPALANQFLAAYLNLDDREGIRRWTEFLFKPRPDGNLKPDAMTFAILLKKYANDDQDECEKCFERMKSFGIEKEDIVKLKDFFNDKELAFLGSRMGLDFDALNNKGQMIDLGSIMNDLCLPKTTESPRRDTSLPEAKSIQSKSEGITFLKQAIRTLREDPEADLYSVQERLERDCYEASSQMLRREMDSLKEVMKTSLPSTVLRKIINQWQEDLAKALKRAFDCSINLHREKNVKIGSGVLFSSILSTLEPEKISLIVLQEITRAPAYDVSVKGFFVNRLSMAVGQALEREVFAQQLKKKTFLQKLGLSPRRLELMMRDKTQVGKHMREIYARMERDAEAMREGWIPRWTQTLKAEIGVFVLSIAIDALKFTTADGQTVPAYKHRIAWHEGQSLGVVEAQEELLQLMTSEAASIFVEPWAMPMLVPPRPWLTFNSGGYLTQKSVCVRMKEDPVHLAIIQHADKSGKLDQILLGLDLLGRIPWRINDRVLKVALDMWNTGINVATLEKPVSQAALEYKRRDLFGTQEEYISYVREATDRKEELNKSHSTMCDTNYKLEIARQFAGLDFYLPHSVDFRGRAYPIPPHLSHVGSDLSRGLLIFAQGKPLGARGLRWLKIQLANMAGFDKATLDEREAFADQHRQEIMDSADKPLEGGQWWKKAEEPWQCLATCIELTNAWRSVNPEEFISHIPCQQDGSCNGLQHYAALGGDVDGATQVNLAPSARKQDVYSAVASLVNAQLEQDAKSDPKHIANHLLGGKINRKIIKQTVMTNVYGVTQYGARAQIEARLKEYQLVDPSQYGEARRYLASAVFKSLGKLFDNAQRIQTWLTQTASEIAHSVPPEVVTKFGSELRAVEGEDSKEGAVDPADRYPQTSVLWTTPLGFEVLQPYTHQKKVALRTVLQSLSLRLSSKFDPVNARKQASAFPPNFIHSLDATHMFMTALACQAAGLTFASVHDCFWTHAASVDQMSRLLREQFVNLHSQPILARLREEFVQRYQGYMVPEGTMRSGGSAADLRYLKVTKWREICIPPIPPKGDFDISQVLQSQYFFS